MEKPFRKWPLVRFRKRWLDNVMMDLVTPGLCLMTVLCIGDVQLSHFATGGGVGEF
jgi:hypothetical protein